MDFERLVSSDRVVLWEGWYFVNNCIYDPAGNRYSKRDVEFSFFTESIVDGFVGKKSNIRILKQELAEKIALTVVPKVCLVFDYDGGVVERVFDLNEIV